ncbi:MAG: hypothetical protein ACE5HQ_01195 [Gemmatimonadota bacterium]
MSDSDGYARSLREHGLEDLQPLYRPLLRRLKSLDSGAYDEAVARYRQEVQPAARDPDGSGSDPVAVWLAYGSWLAARLAPGSVMAIAENGRAEPTAPPLPLGEMLIHLPQDSRKKGFVLAMPAHASDAQRETAALLCE